MTGQARRAEHAAIERMLALFEDETGRAEQRVNRLETDTAFLRHHFDRIKDRLSRLSLDIEAARRRRTEEL